MKRQYRSPGWKRRALVLLLLIAVLALAAGGIATPAGAAKEEVGRAPSVKGDGVHHLGWLPSDTTGFRCASTPLSSKPLGASVNLASQIPPVKNQGDQNSCVAWSTSYTYKSWSEKKKDSSRNLKDPACQFSPSFMYNQINGGVDDGASFDDAFTLLEEKGDISIKEMPYDDTDYKTQPTSAQLVAAGAYRISSDWNYLWAHDNEGPYTPSNSISAAKSWLASGKMLVMGMPIFQDFPDTYENPPSPYYVYDGFSDYDGGHGVAIVGYNDSINPGGADADHRGGFLMANSWGPEWNGAGKGFIYLSYHFVKKYIQEAWVMNDLPRDTSTWYLAEGTTDWGFNCNIGIMNPNSSAVTVKVTYMTDSGPVDGGTFPLNAMSSIQVEPASVLGNKDFSTKVECLEKKPIAVDRNMFFPPGGGGAVFEGHSSVGVTSPAGSWYLPEGSSSWGFECWLLIQNPNASKATCRVTYMAADGPIEVAHEVPANSRRTFNIAQDIGNEDASIKVDSNVPVIPERAMYRNGRREGHDSIGTTSTATDYFLAEGTTDWGFTTFVLVQNPNSSATEVTVTYMTPSGPKRQPAFTMPAESRTTIRVNDIPEVSKTDLSTRVHGTKPIIAERAMYWNGGADGGEACHDSIGMADPHYKFYLPSGETGGVQGAETFTLVQNLNAVPVNVKVTYVSDNGQVNVEFTATVPAQSRKTFNMADSAPAGRYGVIVESLTDGKPIMVERSMYYLGRACGTDTIGGYAD